jgi:GNAT superfamily N-acetyltransferase
MTRFEQLGPNEGARLRSLRLRSLQDAPDAFGSTYEEAAIRTSDEWTKQVIELPTFVAMDADRDVAMVRCARDPNKSDTAWLLSMWVAPEARRRNIGGTLVNLVLAWARSHGVTRLLLDVADQNLPAVRLYESKGFLPNGHAGAFPPPRQHICEHQRELRITSAFTVVHSRIDIVDGSDER